MRQTAGQWVEPLGSLGARARGDHALSTDISIDAKALSYQVERYRVGMPQPRTVKGTALFMQDEWIGRCLCATSACVGW